MSAVFHEYAHAWTAMSLGDPTAKNAGRLTLNPIAHLDPFGTVLLPLILMATGGAFIGYAKPVPVNPYNLDDQNYGPVKVSAAGPISNFLIAIVFSVILRTVSLTDAWSQAIGIVIYINLILGLFNLIPIPPLDGSKILRRFSSIDLSFGNNPIGMILALVIAFTILPNLAGLLYQVLVGFGI